MNKSYKAIVEKLFFLCRNINDTLFKKEQAGEELTFLDHYVFQASSYIVSLIYNIVFFDRNSFCTSFLIRCLIECNALMKMYVAGEVPQEATELINEYNYIAEYNVYKRYKDKLNGVQFDFDQIENNHELAKEKYRKHSNLSSSEFNKLIQSKVPFLLDEFSFDELIKKYSADYYQYYRLLSVILHPSDMLLTYPVLQKEDLTPLMKRLFADFIDVLIGQYIDASFIGKKTLKQEIDFIFSSGLNHIYMQHATKQKKILFNVAEIIEKAHSENTMSYIFRELGTSIEEMALDKTFGFSEVVKCKFKPVIEILAMSNYLLKLPHTIEKHHLEQLITKHTRINLMAALDLDFSNENKDAFELMKKENKDVNKEEFLKNFKHSLGFSPKKISINKLVRSLIDDFIPKNETFNSHMKMVYDEAQLLSHANGYMISSNSGAFMEYSSVIPFVDYLISALLDYYIAEWKLYDIYEGEGKHADFISSIKNCLNDFSKEAKLKNEMDKKWQKYKVTY
ncbi:MAG TPA: hypothetical protein PK340_01165 [Bacilli bacterium]|nr:hypothetical protein [Bacilli bacterium]